MSLKIIQAGTFTTIQDAGRMGYAHLGLPISGFMDEKSAQLANWMVGNQPGDALLEVTWTGIEFIIAVDCSMVVAGAEFECFLNNETINTDQTIGLKAGDHFKMGRLLKGVRGYLAFAGSVAVPEVAGSFSTLVVAGLGGYLGRQLQADDELQLNNPSIVSSKSKPQWKKLKSQRIHVIRAMPGPEFNYFNPPVIRQAFGQTYQVTSDANRQGFRLLSVPIESPGNSVMNSSGLLPGSLQVTPDGQTILAMKDAQTTGGYPRILVVNQDQLHHLAQIRPGENFYFFVAEAQR